MGPVDSEVLRSAQRERQLIIEAQTLIRNAKNELALAVMALKEIDHFKNSLSAMKGTINDLVVLEKHLDKFIAD